MALLLIAQTVAGCGGASSASQAGVMSPRAEATTPERPALDRWYVVRSSDARALPAGSGVRLRADGYDSASEGRGFSMGGRCELTDADLRCEASGASIRMVATDEGTLEVTQGPLVLRVSSATPEEAARFEATLAEQASQAAACTNAARCCREAEETLNIPCDLDSVLGDRSRQSCDAALARIREAAATYGDAAPASCR